MRRAIAVSMALAPAACIVVVWPAVLHAQSDDQAPSLPAFNQADIPTAAVTPGVKILLEGITFDRADHLGIELNVADFWCPTSSEDEVLNLRNVAIIGEVAPVGGEHARARELGDWRIGIDWAIIDETNLFRPEAITALKTAARQAIDAVVTPPETLRQEQNQIFNVMEFDTRSALNAHFDASCVPAAPAFGPDQWVQDRPELQQALDNASAACTSGSGQQVRKDELVTQLLSAVRAWLSTHKCDRLDIDEPFPALSKVAKEWANQWDAICAPRKKVDWSTLEATRKRLATGLVLSAEVFLVGHTEVSSMMDGSDDVTLSRTVDLELSGEAAYRNEDVIPLDITLNLFRLSTGPGNVTTQHGLTVNVASPAVSWSDSGMVLSVRGALDLDFARASSANVAYSLQQRLAVPLASKVFLVLDVSEAWIEGTGWDVRPSFSLAWSYAKDGKDLARTIETSL
jgi:hypothetical protein